MSAMSAQSPPAQEIAKKHYVTTFYKFVPTENPEEIKLELENFAREKGVLGLVILGHEGINSTVSAPSAEILFELKTFLGRWFQDLFFKDSVSEVQPFRRFSVKVKPEIVTLGAPGLAPFGKSENHHLSPEEWNLVLKNEDVVLIDTRNWYETQIGTFKNALVPDIEQFTEFPKYLEEQNISKDQKVLIFCTGGIRCEKGILDLQNQGFNNVFQLEGGIINYIKEFPNEQFEGECFVFDHRVALDQNLAPTKKFGLCPHCGQPGSKKIECRRCDSEAYVCDDCTEVKFIKETCSKNCAHHYELHPGRKGPKQEPGWRKP